MVGFGVEEGDVESPSCAEGIAPVRTIADTICFSRCSLNNQIGRHKCKFKFTLLQISISSDCNNQL